MPAMSSRAAARAAAALDRAFQSLPQGVQDEWLAAQRQAADKREQVKATLLDTGEPVIDAVLEDVGRTGRKMVVGQDKYTPRFIRRFVSWGLVLRCHGATSDLPPFPTTEGRPLRRSVAGRQDGAETDTHQEDPQEDRSRR